MPRRAETPQLDPVVQEALKDVSRWTYPRRRVLPRQAPLALRKLLAPYLRKQGIYQGGPAPIKPQRSLNDPSAKAAAIHAFKHLKHHGYVFEPDLVCSWALMHRWSRMTPSSSANTLLAWAAASDTTRARIRLEEMRFTDGESQAESLRD